MQLAKESGLDSRVNKDSLRHYVRRELRRLRIDGLPVEVEETKKFLVMVDIDKVHEMASLPPKERAIALSKLLRTSQTLKLSNLAAGRALSSVESQKPDSYAIYIRGMFRDSSGCSTFLFLLIFTIRKRSLPIREKRIPDFGRAY